MFLPNARAISRRVTCAAASEVYHHSMTFDPHALKLYVDGSCLKNPGGASGLAAWIEYPSEWDRADELLNQFGFHESTNNRMELRACIWAHEWVRDQCHDAGVSRIQIITDSKYVYDNWRRAAYWRANGWRNASNRRLEAHRRSNWSVLEQRRTARCPVSD
jgi:ribonuclease HI